MCTVFHSISSNIDEVISINPSANVFVFGDFNVHRKDWLAYTGGTDRSELFYSLSQTTLLRWLTLLLGFQTVILTVMPIWIVVLQGLSHHSDHFVVLVSIEFPSYSQQDALFHCIAYDYSCADWDGLCDHLRDVHSCSLSASAAASEFCERVQVGTDVHIPH